MNRQPAIKHFSTVFRRSALLCILALAACGFAYGQIDTKIRVSENIRRQKEVAKTMQKEFRNHRKAARKSVRQTTKETLAAIDSLRARYGEAAWRELEALIDKGQLTPAQQMAVECLKERGGKVTKRDVKERAKSYAQNLPPLPNEGLTEMQLSVNAADSSRESWDITAERAAERLARETSDYRAIEQAAASAPDVEELPSAHPMQYARQAGMKHISLADPRFTKAAQELDKYKKKYQYIRDAVSPAKDSRPGESRKIASLQGEPLVKRLQWSGHFHLEAGAPLLIDFSPGMAYRLDKNIAFGAGAALRFSSEGSLLPAAGLRVFGESRVWKSFSAYCEYERMTRAASSAEAVAQVSNTMQSVNAGLARTFSIYKGLKGKAMILYNIDLNDGGFYHSKWVARVGVGK